MKSSPIMPSAAYAAHVETPDEIRKLESWDVCRAFDVPPWMVGDTPPPRFRRIRWALRRRWPV
jgi:hypothetical protein